jgi:hypothetical protein
MKQYLQGFITGLAIIFIAVVVLSLLGCSGSDYAPPMQMNEPLVHVMPAGAEPQQGHRQ